MSFDAHKNLAISTVVTPPAPATSGTTLTVTAGEGGRFPAVPFNVTIWPASQPPTPSNAEVARVTAMSGDAITALTRAAEGSIARSIVAGDLIAATITVKALTDVESGTNFPLLTTPGAGSFGGNLSVAGDLILGKPISLLCLNTNDGADTGLLQLHGGGGGGNPTRGAHINLMGNEQPGQGGKMQLAAGDGPDGTIEIYTKPGYTMRGKIHASGGFSWGGTTDPGAATFAVTPVGLSIGQAYVIMNPAGYIQTSVTSTTSVGHHVIVNPNGIVGTISTTGSSTTYNTTSDHRLKTDRGLLTDPEVLRHTKIHHFTWNTDNTPGRGVFAQEAITVAPFAVSVGSDERDEHGNLKQPWGVDYSKYVPDLIVGWQSHDRMVERLEQRLSDVNREVILLRARAERPTLINRIMTAIRAWWTPSDIESEAHQVARPCVLITQLRSTFKNPKDRCRSFTGA